MDSKNSSFLITLVVLGSLIGGLSYVWNRWGGRSTVMKAVDVMAGTASFNPSPAKANLGGSPGAFFEVPAPSDLAATTVIVFAPENCPRDAGQRADHLENELRRHIPYTRTNSASFRSYNDPDLMQRLNAVMTGPPPIVFVNGKGRANPTIEEVLAELGTPDK